MKPNVLKRLTAGAAVVIAAVALAFATASDNAAGAAEANSLPNATPGPHGSVPAAYPLAAVRD